MNPTIRTNDIVHIDRVELNALTRKAAAHDALLAACKAALPSLEADAGASHLTDGFGPRKRTRADEVLELAKVAIAAATSGEGEG